MIEVYDNYQMLGINSRPITYGEEFDMVKSFIDYKKNSFKEKENRQLAIFLETKINDSYPDVIFAEFNPLLYKDWNYNRNRLSNNDLKVLFYIHRNHKVLSQTIAQELSIHYKTLIGSIEALLDADIINRKDGFWVVKNPHSVFGVKKIEAVEAKISKWDRVLQQALINQTFASESFVLSKRKKQPDEKVVKRITDFGIGIYLYNSSCFSCISKAKNASFPLSYNSIFLNECIGRILSR